MLVKREAGREGKTVSSQGLKTKIVHAPRTANMSRVSDVLECVFSLSVLQPLRRPAGFDAGPILQQSVILSQHWVTLSRQPTEQRAGMSSHNIYRSLMMSVRLPENSPTDPNWKRTATVGKTVTSASEKDFPAR